MVLMASAILRSGHGSHRADRFFGAAVIQQSVIGAATHRAAGDEKRATTKHQELADDFMNNATMHIGQTAIDAIMANGKPLVIDAQQMQHRGVDVVDLR